MTRGSEKLEEIKELREILEWFSRYVPKCKACGVRPATREAHCDCNDCRHCADLYCDKCDVPLTKKLGTTWNDMDASSMMRRLTKALKL